MIDQLLSNIEDKTKNFSTTSLKFKRDLWNFFNSDKGRFYGDKVAVEYGTHKGQTTRILAHLFGKVYTYNLPDNFDTAKKLNADLTNIEYIGLDLYNSPIEELQFTDSVSMFLIDALHTRTGVLTDFCRAQNTNKLNPCYVVFDDYGMYQEVRETVDDLIWVGKLDLIQYIGHEPDHDFGQGRVLKHHEGIITKFIHHENIN